MEKQYEVKISYLKMSEHTISYKVTADNKFDRSQQSEE